MPSLLCSKELQKAQYQDEIGNLFKELKKSVSSKTEDLKKKNEALPRPLEKYPIFDRPDLLKTPGTEVTLIVRKNFNKLLLEADKYCALPVDSETGLRIPTAQAKDLEKMVFENRIFLQSKEDHQRARIEFDVTKNNLVEGWQKKYKMDWPRYNKDVLLRSKIEDDSDEKPMAAKGKKVSRHHFLPVRAVLIKEGSELEDKLNKGEFNPALPQRANHYLPNDSRNLIPSLYPKDHLGGLHHSDSVFSSIFGPIKRDYQYEQVNPDDPNRFTYAVPKELQYFDIPSFAKDFEYFLQKMEERMGYELPRNQKEKLVSFVNDFVKMYPYEEKVVEDEDGSRVVFEKKLEELDYNDVLKNVMYIKKQVAKKLKSEWEDNTGNTWPQKARAEFLIPPFFKPKKYEWWMVAPSRKS